MRWWNCRSVNADDAHVQKQIRHGLAAPLDETAGRECAARAAFELRSGNDGDMRHDLFSGRSNPMDQTLPVGGAMFAYGTF